MSQESVLDISTLTGLTPTAFVVESDHTDRAYPDRTKSRLFWGDEVHRANDLVADLDEEHPDESPHEAIPLVDHAHVLALLEEVRRLREELHSVRQEAEHTFASMLSVMRDGDDGFEQTLVGVMLIELAESGLEDCGAASQPKESENQ